MSADNGGMGLFHVLFHSALPSTLLSEIGALLMVYGRTEPMTRLYRRLQNHLEGHALVLLDGNLVVEGLEEVDEIIAAHPDEVHFIYAIRLHGDWKYLNPEDDMMGEKLEVMIAFAMEEEEEEEARSHVKRSKPNPLTAFSAQ